MVDNAIHRINHYPLDIAIGFAITYPVDSAIHRLNNWGLVYYEFHFGKQPQHNTFTMAIAYRKVQRTKKMSLKSFAINKAHGSSQSLLCLFSIKPAPYSPEPHFGE